MTQIPDPASQISQRITEINEQYQNYGLSGLAQAYEEFKKEVTKEEVSAYKGEAGKMVLDRIKDLENLFAAVTGNDVKELSMFMKDSEALKRTAELASINAEHLRFGDLGGTHLIADFVKGAKMFINPDTNFHPNVPDTDLAEDKANETFNSFDWRKLSNMFYSSGRNAIPSSFLYGPLATKRRRVVPRARTVDDTLHRDKTTAQNVSAREIHDDAEQSTSHMVRTVYGVLDETSGSDRVNFFQFFVNPHSFAQLVENLFYTSFLVRDGKLKIDTDEAGVPYVEIPETESEVDAEAIPVAHHIATFDVPTWKALIAKYHITELYLPHRDVEEDEYVESDSEQEAEVSDG